MSETFSPMDRMTMPCLFCGNTEAQEMAFVTRKTPNKNYELIDMYRVNCSCGACGPEEESKQKAVDKWNEAYSKKIWYYPIENGIKG